MYSPRSGIFKLVCVSSTNFEICQPKTIVRQHDPQENSAAKIIRLNAGYAYALKAPRSTSVSVPVKRYSGWLIKFTVI